MTGFKLVHHYSLVTSTTFKNGSPSSQFASQFVVPAFGFKEPALMHALLALSAIHLHKLYDPLGIADQDYFSLGQEHKSKALALDTSPAPSDIHSLTRIFLAVYNMAESFAVLGPPGLFTLMDTVRDTLRGEDYFRFFQDEQLWPLDWPFNCQGVRIVPTEVEEQLLSISYMADTSHLFPPLLKRIHLPDTAWPDSDELVLDPAISAVYKASVDALRASWYLCHLCPGNGLALASATSWVVRMTDEFRHLLVVERRPRALVILYYYCLMLSHLDPQQCWWAGKHAECMAWIRTMLSANWVEGVMAAMPGVER
ncbi:hypothetical protein VNI00_008614 [Paramarasmius palmivorus]|uniref:Uncharacterized protein n=1 Tax=Paramarasmius palmivorus TaxID=297713 RepID=A0AAW0CY26_9AGAR